MSAAEEFTREERELMKRILLKLTKGTVLDERPKPVVREPVKPGAEDFEYVDRVRRRRGIR